MTQNHTQAASGGVLDEKARDWKAVPQGGSSTVISMAKPGCNDTRIPPYGYNEANGHCIAYPFLEDDGRARLDFVCFAHDDARLIAAAPDLLAALVAMMPTNLGVPPASIPDTHLLPVDMTFGEIRQARAAILKATGGAA